MKPDSYLDFVMDLLVELPGLRSRAMFGGHGLYQGEMFFGIVYKGLVYFKTNQDTRKKYEAEGMQAFPPSDKQTLKNYLEVPPRPVGRRRTPARMGGGGSQNLN